MVSPAAAKRREAEVFVTWLSEQAGARAGGIETGK
jgi:hypothetical protein